MTTFEIIVTVAIIAIVVLLTILKCMWNNQKSQEKRLDLITVQIANIWRVQDKVENNAAITASIVGKMYNNGISDKENPQFKADIKQKIIQMSSNNTAAMLENMADIRKEQIQEYYAATTDADDED